MEVVERMAMQVIGIEVIAPWQDLWTRVPLAWEELRARSGEIGNRASESFVDVSVEERDGTYRQVVGAEVRPAEAVPEGMIVLEIPYGRFVHLRHEGGLEEIARSFGRMYAWAGAEGHRVDAFKLDAGYTQEGGERLHDLYVRLAGGAAS